MKRMTKRLCGIDEAGRGPLAGPLIMAGVVLPSPIEGLCDSKALSAAKREALYETIVSKARYCIVRFSPEEIDRLGMSVCLKRGLETIKNHFGKEADYLFDGNSSFGVAGIRTQVKADVDVPEVSAASIVAKVTRDKEMIALAQTYPEYGFDKHKGYATKTHYEALYRYGRSPVHRKSFRVKGLDEPTLF